MTTPRTISLLALLALCSAPARAQEAQGEVVRGELGAQLDRAVREAGGPDFWGTALVAQGGEVALAKGYGFADYAARSNRPDTLFELASTSKPITALAVLRLVQAKKLRLETTLPEVLDGVPADKRGVTVHHLLTHTSGIDNEVGLPYASPASREEFLRFVLAAKMTSKPGERFAYFNSGYALLAAIVEVVSGHPFEAFVEASVFAPAGMQDTGFIRDADLDRARASTRLEGMMPDATCVDWFWGWGYRGMGGVVSTAPDLLKLDRALRGEGILSAEMRALAYTPYKEGYALGWQVEALPDGSTKVHHAGSVAGYGIHYVRWVEQDVVVVVLSNGKTNPYAVSGALERLLAPKPEVGAALDLRGLRLNQHKAAELEGAGFEVKAKQDDVFLLLRAGRLTPASLRLPRKVARRLLADLEALIPGQAAKPKGATAGLYLGRYQPEGNQLQLDALSLRLEPRYRGVDEAGQEVTDERITLIAVDDARGAWPVMVKLDLRAAKALAKGLGKALD